MAKEGVTGASEHPDSKPSPRGSVLAAVKVSVADVSALDWAAVLAEQGGMTLQITHIIENAPQPMLPHESYGSPPPALSGGPHREARAVLDRASARVQERRPDLAVTPTFQLGGPAAVLIEQSKTAHLLVVGATVASRMKRLLLGSVSLACIQHARCPVVVVPRGYEARPVAQIVVGVDGSASSATAVAFALSIAEATGAALTCVVGWNVEFVDGVMVTERDSAPWNLVQQRYADLVHQVVDPLAAEHPQVPVSVDVRPVWPAYAVLEAAEEVDADLVVVGSRGLGGFRGLLLGSVGKRVVEHAGRPVAIVH